VTRLIPVRAPGRDYNATTTPGQTPRRMVNGESIRAGHGMNQGASATPEMDGLGLENRWVMSLVGSNPTPSAVVFLTTSVLIRHCFRCLAAE